MVWSLYPAKKSLVGGWVGGRPNLMYSPGPGLWSLVLGSFGPDLGPDLDLTWDLDLDLSLTMRSFLTKIARTWPKTIQIAKFWFLVSCQD